MEKLERIGIIIGMVLFFLTIEAACHGLTVFFSLIGFDIFIPGPIWLFLDYFKGLAN